MGEGFDARVRSLREAWEEASKDLGIRAVTDKLLAP
jgi:hypothetical protein